MSNRALEWMKEHPTEALLGVGAIIGVVWLMTRSSGSASQGSALGTYYNAQLQMANINSQNAAQQAQLQAQQNIAAYSAQVQNNQTAAQLAAIAEQYNAQVKTAQLAEQAQNLQTTTAWSVSTNQTNAQLAAIEAELKAQTAVAGYTANYANQVVQSQTELAKQYMTNQYNLQTTALPYVTSFGGSQNRLAFLQSVLGQPGAASATEQSYAGVQASNAGFWSNFWNGLFGASSNTAQTALMYG